MPNRCDQHPTQPAWWKCPRCHKYLCPQCISKRIGGNFEEQVFYFCPKCNVEAATQELSQVIPPFWMRLHKFMVYPFSSIQSAVLILVLSLLTTITQKFESFSFFLQLIFWSLMVKYSFESLKSTAEGRFEPPPLSGSVFSENYGVVFKQIALYFVLIFVFVFFVVKTGPVMMLLLGVACGMALPSMLIILIINDDLGRALNPVVVTGLIFRIGWSYLLLLFFLLLLSGAPTALGYTVIQHMPQQLQLFMITAAKNYYTLITYHMMGYVILQYHHQLDYPVALETILTSMYPESNTVSQPSEHEAEKPNHEDLLNEISLLVQEGELEKAIYRIEEQVEIEKIDCLKLSQRYLQLLKIRKQTEKQLAYASHHLKLIVMSGSKSKAIELYIECLRMDKAFTPQPLVLYKIAGWLDEAGKSKEAIFALNTLIKSYPNDMLVPKTYYRAAKIFNERLKNFEQGKKILKKLLHKFPNHEIALFAKNDLTRL